MWKWVIRDYFTALRWENLKQHTRKTDWALILIYLFITVYFIQKRQMTDMDLVWFVALSFLIYYAEFTGKIHPIKLPKQLFISPIKENKRKDYVTRFCILRMGVSVFVGGCVALLMVILGMVDGVQVLTLTMNMFHLTVVFLGFRNVEVTPEVKERMKVDITAMMGGLEVLGFFIAVMSHFGPYIIYAFELTDWWAKWVFVGISVFVQLPISIVLLRDWSRVMDKAVSYEKSYV